MAVRVVRKRGLVTAVERKRLDQVLVKLSKHFAGLVSIEWDLDIDGGKKTVGCRLHARSGFYRARATGQRFGEAIDAVCEKLERQRRREKEIINARRRRSRADGGGPRQRGVPRETEADGEDD